MKNLFFDYFYVFFHPFKIYKDFHSGEKKPLAFVELMGVSWVFKIVRTFYYFMGIHFLLWLVNQGLSESILDVISNKKIFFYWVLVGVIFYPLFLWLLAKFWIVIVRFFCILYGKDEVILDVNNVCYNSLTSQGLLVVPVVGEVLVPFAFLFFLFAGLKNSLRFTTLQAILVIISPVFIFFLMLTLSLAYFMLILNIV